MVDVCIFHIQRCTVDRTQAGYGCSTPRAHVEMRIACPTQSPFRKPRQGGKHSSTVTRRLIASSFGDANCGQCLVEHPITSARLSSNRNICRPEVKWLRRQFWAERASQRSRPLRRCTYQNYRCVISPASFQYQPLRLFQHRVQQLCHPASLPSV